MSDCGGQIENRRKKVAAWRETRRPGRLAVELPQQPAVTPGKPSSRHLHSEAIRSEERRLAGTFHSLHNFSRHFVWVSV